MLALVLWSSAVLAILGVIVFLVMRTRKRSKPKLTIREAICLAKSTLQNKKQKPKITRYCKIKKSEDIFVSCEQKKLETDRLGSYRFHWPHMELKYCVKQGTEEVRMEFKDHEEVFALFFVEGLITKMAIGSESWEGEHFEMRQAGNISDQLRCFIRHYVRLPGGTMEPEKRRNSDGSTLIDLNETGEIKMSEAPSVLAKLKEKEGTGTR